jgi:hypothetical protein
MTDDPRIKWELLSPFGISIKEEQDAWWSGHVTDVLEMDQGIGGLLVATETGGVWSISNGGTTMPLSDSWDQPNVNCLAAGPDGPRHFYAGCPGGMIYETDLSQSIPLIAWKPIEDALPTGKISPVTGIPSLRRAGNVNRLFVWQEARLIFAACDGGLYWSEIPQMPKKRGCLGKFLPPPAPRAPYTWHRAEEEDEGQRGYFSVAVALMREQTGRARESLNYISIVAGGKNGGVFVGHWGADKLDQLHLRRAKLIDEKNIDWTELLWWTAATGATSVAVCEDRPTHLYASISFPDGRLKMVAHSKDGGRHWWKTGLDIASVPEPKDIRFEAGDQGNSWNNCIAVSPATHRVVAFGWQAGVFLSMDEGNTWQVISDGPHLHADVHALLFTPTVDDKHYLYIGSDGGLAQVDLDDFTQGTLTVRSDYNRWLPTLQCYCTYTVPRNFYGTLSASRFQPTNGWVSSGLQDNGNVYCDPAAGSGWQMKVEGGDGGWTAFVEDGGMLSNIKIDPPGCAVVAARRQDTQLVSLGDPPISIPPPDDPKVVRSPAGDVVRRPRFRNEAGQLMYAVAGSGSNIYGLYPDESQISYHWELLGTLPQGLTISQGGGAIASHTGRSVFVATESGRMFVLDSKGKVFVELPVVLPRPRPSQPQSGGNLHRIVTLSESVAFAIINNTSLNNNYVLRLDGLRWAPPLSAGLPLDQFFYAIEGMFQENRQLIFVTTDDRVYMSEDAGNNWVPASRNLPRRPHCADLRVSILDIAQSWLYLSTYGRSVWRAPLHLVHHG